MNERLIKTILDYLTQNRIIDKQSSKKISKLSKEKENTLGSILVDYKFFDEDNLFILLLDFYKNKIVSLEDISREFSIDSEKFLRSFAKNMDLEYLDLDSCDVDYTISNKVSLEKLKRYKALPIKEDTLNIYVALKDPLNIPNQENVQRLFGRKLLKPIIAQPDQIEKYLNKMDLQKSIKGLVDSIRKELASNSIDESQDSSGILKLIQTILKTSILARSSDIHIEPTKNNCIVRSRIDGMLSETFIFDKDIYPPLCSRLKLLSNMDIAEKRKPQDGRFSATIMGKEYDFRISTLPIANGESMVLRILDKSKVMIKLEDLGMHRVNYERFSKAMKAPHGIIFVTGPTGSGKTTTLYATLNAIKSIQTKIITIEDPVEYQLDLTLQTQVNEKAGLSFASALRSILRQDPDIIMIGEVRDTETLRIAIQAALTGHLVFSTLHTNDAISAVTRIVDMGIEPYLISGSLVAIEAQRLVRKLCPYCKKEVIPHPNIIKDISKYLPKNYNFYKNVGCEKCLQTGYMGRKMLSEVLPVSEKIASMIAKGYSKDKIKIQADKEGFVSIFEDGIIKAARGITSLDEVMRVSKF
ncbi:MAG: general secretion pathway protein GspE [Proteobacteria bacterium]|nr:MAG: general secretion pathway protein GspE [Pseudomonadota bacterium]